MSRASIHLYRQYSLAHCRLHADHVGSIQHLSVGYSVLHLICWMCLIHFRWKMFSFFPVSIALFGGIVVSCGMTFDFLFYHGAETSNVEFAPSGPGHDERTSQYCLHYNHTECPNLQIPRTLTVETWVGQGGSWIKTWTRRKTS